MKRNFTIQRLAHLTGHQSSIYTLEKAPEPHCFFSADGNGWVVKWDLHNTEVAKVIAQVPSNIFSLCLVREELLAVGSMQGILYFINLKKNEVVEPPVQLDKSIFDLRMYQGYLYAVCGDGILYVFNAGGRELVKKLKVSPKALRSIHFHPSEPIAVVGSSDNQVYLVDIDKWQVVSELAYHQNSVFTALFTNDGKTILSGSRDAHLAAWQFSSLESSLLHTIPAHNFTINSMSYHADWQLLATASRDKTIKLWDAQQLRLLKVLDPQKAEMEAHTHSVNTLLWLDYNDLLISAGDDRTIMAWQMAEK